ncbi:MAG: cadherin repeat domain-containing protein, partial [Gemmobacter sp.]
VVRATDGGGLWHEATSTVAVLDVNERPTLYGAWYEVEENSPEGTRVGAPLVATDPDFGQVLLFDITGGDAGDVFRVGACSGQIEVAEAVLDYETRIHYRLVVTVEDNGVPRLSHSAVVNITLLDVNEPPVMQDVTHAVEENSAVGTAVGARIVATDPDFGQVLLFDITGG